LGQDPHLKSTSRNEKKQKKLQAMTKSALFELLPSNNSIFYLSPLPHKCTLFSEREEKNKKTRRTGS
jgi:hypothetical protein